MKGVRWEHQSSDDDEEVGTNDGKGGSLSECVNKGEGEVDGRKAHGKCLSDFIRDLHDQVRMASGRNHDFLVGRGRSL